MIRYAQLELFELSPIFLRSERDTRIAPVCFNCWDMTLLLPCLDGRREFLSGDLTSPWPSVNRKGNDQPHHLSVLTIIGNHGLIYLLDALLQLVYLELYVPLGFCQRI